MCLKLSFLCYVQKQLYHHIFMIAVRTNRWRKNAIITHLYDNVMLFVNLWQIVYHHSSSSQVHCLWWLSWNGLTPKCNQMNVFTQWLFSKSLNKIHAVTLDILLTDSQSWPWYMTKFWKEILPRIFVLRICVRDWPQLLQHSVSAQHLSYWLMHSLIWIC